jgi:hypothetical protein|tara:strand:+ start:1004 stop:1333 length:330 start_codon:yes stop_codon:yes gene_type:complete
MSKNDIYQIVDYPSQGENYGSYKGKSPGQVAKKVTTFLGRKAGLYNKNNNSKKFIVFTIVNNRTKKEYKYTGTRVKLDKPIKIYIKDTEIEYNYKTIVTKYDKNHNNMN